VGKYQAILRKNEKCLEQLGESMARKLASTISHSQSLREIIAQIAAKVGCTTRILSNWKNGQRPGDYNINKLSEVLEIDLWPLYTKQDPISPISIVTTAMPLAFGMLPAIGTPSMEKHIDQAMQHFISQQLAQLWQNFHFAGDTASIITVQLGTSAHIQLLQSFTSWPLATNDQFWLARAMSDAYILAGRITRDQMDYIKAIEQHKAGLTLAQQSHSMDHIAAATMRLAETLWEAGLPYDALAYCKAGIGQTKQASPRIRGELLGLAAMLYSSFGESKESKRLLEEAALLSVGAAKMPTTGGINFSETAAASYLSDVALHEGDTRTALYHSEQARKLLIVEFPEGHNIRWEAHLWINEALAHSEAKEIEAACANLRQAVHLAQSINSQITLKKIQDATRELTIKQRQPIPELRALSEELMHISITRLQ
jgi:tetratricopeptide (TPR) repeat protein